MTDNIDVAKKSGKKDQKRANPRYRWTPTSQKAKVDEVEIYLEEAGKVALLSRDQEVDLAKRIEAGRAASKKLARGNGHNSKALNSIIEDGVRAREHLILANLRLVISVAKRYQNLGLPLLDLIQEGNLGLMRAIKKFDYRRGYKFSTYATWWIRQAISRAVADKGRVIRLPVHVHTQLRQIKKAKQRLRNELEREPSAREIAAQVDIKPQRIRELMRQTQASITLDNPDADDEDAAMFERIPDEDAPDPAEQLSQVENVKSIETLLELLTPREERILRLRFGLQGSKPLSLGAIGEKIELTRERVRQIEEAALDQLRQEIHGPVKMITL